MSRITFDQMVAMHDAESQKMNALIEEKGIDENDVEALDALVVEHYGEMGMPDRDTLEEFIRRVPMLQLALLTGDLGLLGQIMYYEGFTNARALMEKSNATS